MREHKNNDYRFIDKDPVIDVIRTAMQRGGNLGAGHIDRIAYESGVSAGTIYNWLHGDTRRPQSLSTRFVLEACGVHIRYEMDGKDMRMPKPELITKAEQKKILDKDAEREREREKARAKSK